MRHIASKTEFYALSKKLLLGNRLQQWDFPTFEQLILASDPILPKIVGVRHVRQSFTNKGASGLFPRAKAYQYALRTPDKHNLLFDEGSVHSDLTLQGEVCATERGLYLRWSKLQVHQRTLWHSELNGLQGLRKHQLPYNWKEYFCRHSDGVFVDYRPIVEHSFGLQASAILQKYFDEDSWQTLNEILSCQIGEENSWGDLVLNFVHPIVEFACFSKPVGVLQKPVLFWEVRDKY